ASTRLLELREAQRWPKLLAAGRADWCGQRPVLLRGAGQRAVLTVLVGAVAIAFSGILFRLSRVSPSSGAFYRCVWALPPLWVLARLEDRRFGKRNRRSIAVAW